MRRLVKENIDTGKKALRATPPMACVCTRLRAHGNGTDRADAQTRRRADAQTRRQADRQTGRQADRQTQRADRDDRRARRNRAGLILDLDPVRVL